MNQNIRKSVLGAFALTTTLSIAPTLVSAQALPKADASHVMHTASRDPEFSGVVMNLDVVDALSENQKKTMMASFRQQYQSRGFDLNHLPTISYKPVIIDRPSDYAVGTSVFTTRSKTQSGSSENHTLVLYGIDGSTFHKVVCSGVTNVFMDPACLNQAQSVFGKLTPAVD